MVQRHNRPHRALLVAAEAATKVTIIRLTNDSFDGNQMVGRPQLDCRVRLGRRVGVGCGEEVMEV